LKNNIDNASNIDSLIGKFHLSSNKAKNEEDIRICTNLFLDSISNFYNISKDYNSEVTSLLGGRADSIYSNIIFEFKTPHKFNNENGINEAIYGRNENDRGLFHYLINFTLDEVKNSNDSYFQYILKSKVGIGYDGSKFIFVRFVDDSEELNLFHKNKTHKWPNNIHEKQKLKFEIEISDNFRYGIKKLLLFVRSTNRKRLTANELLSSFSANSEITQNSILYLYKLLESSLKKNTRIKTLFDEWNRIFGDIYGKHETDFTKYKDELVKMYGLSKNLKIRNCLFVLQTYYSIVIKLLVHNLLESLSNPLQNIKKPNYKNELIALFSGNHYTNYQINNFFEIHFFEWFIFVEKLDLDFINDIINELDTYETTASVIKPEIVEDVLKKVYINLIPRELRHLLGEYYTPNWLVDFTLDKSGYDYSLSTSVLDPTCGSGTFITHAIKRIIQKNKNTVNNKTIIKDITTNVVGFDINPIAVISGKANYILSLGDITEMDEEINIPIYMCDSILVPTVHAKQKETKHSILIDTFVGQFEIPVFETREQNDYFLKNASTCILHDYTTFDEFYELLIKDNFLTFNNEQLNLAKNFYDKLYDLHLSGRNGFWPIILKNSFAPLFSQSKFDFIIGNPPWITWKAMSDTYRTATLDIWLSYGIFEKSAYDKITSHDDFAMAVTYVSIDHYLKDYGIAGFILPQTFVKSSKGGEGFRKFNITRDGLSIPFSIKCVYDMVAVNPFKGEATNRASVYFFKKNEKMKYPLVEYYECYNIHKRDPIKYDDSYEDIKKKISFEQYDARPINENQRSPWLTLKSKRSKEIYKYLGESQYRGRKGIEPCGAKGIYLVKIHNKKGKEVLIENLIHRSRLKKAIKLGVKQGYVEKELIYPMVGGRNIDKWGINSYLYIVLPHENKGKGIYRGIVEKKLKSHYPKTYKWLYYFKDLLLETRIRSGKFFDAKQFPFYRLDNVGPYTFSKYKVVWREQSKKMTACVISSCNDQFINRKIFVNDSKVLYCSFNEENEAHYLCGVINSNIISEIIESYTIDIQKGIDIVKNIRIPNYDPHNKDHTRISKISKEFHEAYSSNIIINVAEKEELLDNLVESIF